MCLSDCPFANIATHGKTYKILGEKFVVCDKKSWKAKIKALICQLNSDFSTLLPEMYS